MVVFAKKPHLRIVPKSPGHECSAHILRIALPGHILSSKRRAPDTWSLGRFQIWRVTSGPGSNADFRVTVFPMGARSGRMLSSPQRPSLVLPSAASDYQSRQAQLSFLTYPCHLSSYSLMDREKAAVRNVDFASPGRRELKQTTQRQLSPHLISKCKCVYGKCLHYYNEVCVPSTHWCF